MKGFKEEVKFLLRKLEGRKARRVVGLSINRRPFSANGEEEGGWSTNVVREEYGVGLLKMEYGVWSRPFSANCLSLWKINKELSSGKINGAGIHLLISPSLLYLPLLVQRRLG